MSERDVMIDLSYLDEETSESASRPSSKTSDSSTRDAKSKKSKATTSSEKAGCSWKPSTVKDAFFQLS